MIPRSWLKLILLLSLLWIWIYQARLRPRLLAWGASALESKQSLPGDDLVPDDELLLQTTRSITIQARPSEIWPWLVQIGQGRGGFYSYDWLENLFQMDIHNAQEILPQYQDLKVGEVVPFWKGVGVSVRDMQKDSHLVMAGSMQPGAESTGGSWAFLLQPLDHRNTRLTIRTRVGIFPPEWLSRLFSLLLLEPAHYVMERRMLMGIRERAEFASAAG